MRALALLLLAPALAAQPRVTSSYEVRLPEGARVQSAVASLDAGGGIVVAAPVDSSVHVVRATAEAMAWEADVRGAGTGEPTLTLVPEHTSGYALGIANGAVRPSQFRNLSGDRTAEDPLRYLGAVGVRLDLQGRERSRTDLAPRLPEALRAAPQFVGGWDEGAAVVLGARYLPDGSDALRDTWLVLTEGWSRARDNAGDTLTVQALGIARYDSDGAEAWAVPLNAAPSGEFISAMNTDHLARNGVMGASAFRFPLDVFISAAQGTGTQSTVVEVDVETGQGRPSDGFGPLTAAYESGKEHDVTADAATDWMTQTLTAETLRLGRTGYATSRTVRPRGAMSAQTIVSEEYVLETDGPGAAYKWTREGAPPVAACGWAGDIAVFTQEPSTEAEGRPLSVRVLSRDESGGWTATEDLRLLTRPLLTNADGSSSPPEIDVLGCSEDGEGALWLAVASRRRFTSSSDAPLPPAVTVYELAR